MWQGHPEPSYNHNDSRSNLSLLRTPTIPRKSPRKENICLDELVLFQAADKIVVDIDSIPEQSSPRPAKWRVMVSGELLFMTS